MEQAGIEYVQLDSEEIVGKFSAEAINDSEGNEVVPLNEELTVEHLAEVIKAGVSEFRVLFIDGVNADASFRNTLVGDKVETKEEAIIEIYKRMRPGDPPTIESATTLFDNLFFNADRYDLSAVGRIKLNEKLGVDVPLETRTLTKEDILKNCWLPTWS